MKVNMLEAKSQLSKLVKAALEGADVVIARDGTPAVRLVPVARKGGLAGWGKLRRFATAVDAAFAVTGHKRVRSPGVEPTGWHDVGVLAGNDRARRTRASRHARREELFRWC